MRVGQQLDLGFDTRNRRCVVRVIEYISNQMTHLGRLRFLEATRRHRR